MGNVNLNDQVAQILIVISLILSVTCSPSPSKGSQSFQYNSYATTIQAPRFPINTVDLRQFYTTNNSSNLISYNQYTYSTQPVTPQPPFETQQPKQVRFTSQDAVGVRPQHFDSTNEQIRLQQQQQLQKYQQLSQQHFQQPEFLIDSSKLNSNGRIWDLQNLGSGQQQQQPSRQYSAWSPVAKIAQQHQQQQQTPTMLPTAAGINRMELLGVVPSPTEVPDDYLQERSWRGEEFNDNQNSKTNVTIETDSRSRRRSLGRLYAGARDLVTGAFKQYATSEINLTFRNGPLPYFARTTRKQLFNIFQIGSLVLGSGLLAAAIPLAVLVLPSGTHERREDKDSIGRPSLSTTRQNNLQGRVDSVMGWIERSVEHLPNFPRLHPQECVKRSICEAHNEPNKYGAIGFVLRLFFPATNLSVTDRMDDMEYKVINKYRHAAGYGLNKRLDNNGTGSTACREKYEDCLVSLLDVAQNLIDIFLK